MIISYPTGFYATVIGVQPGVPSNITFQISNNPPPRTQLLFVKTPVGLSRRKRPPRVYTDGERRATVSKLAFSVTSSAGSQITTGMKQFESGETLDFDVGRSVDKVNPMLVPSTSEVRHDTNLLDYDALGLDETTQGVIDDQAAAAHKQLLEQLNVIVRQRADYETQLQTVQKLLNEVGKTIAGLIGVLEISPDNQTLVAAKDELLDKQVQLRLRQRDLVVLANRAAADAVAVKDKADQVAQLVR